MPIVGTVERLSGVNGGDLVKYILLVHHDEKTFGSFSETNRRQMLEESVGGSTSTGGVAVPVVKKPRAKTSANRIDAPTQISGGQVESLKGRVAG